MTDDPVIDLEIQLVAASVLLGLVVAVSGIAGKADFGAVPLKTWSSLAFLIIASTVIGYAVFMALSKRASPTLANTYNYFAPVIALVLSALLLGEPLDWRKLAAAGVTLAGVALRIKRREKVHGG